MLSHISLGVRDLGRATAFYDPVMATLGWSRVWDDETGVGYGPASGADIFSLFVHPDAAAPGPGFHIAFDAPSRAVVEAFHAIALAAGATDDGPPGPRPNYTPTYYAAFVIDPEGYKLEMVHH